MPVKGNAALRYIRRSSWAKEQQKDLISLLLEFISQFFLGLLVRACKSPPFFSQARAAEPMLTVDGR